MILVFDDLGNDGDMLGSCGMKTGLRYVTFLRCAFLYWARSKEWGIIIGMGSKARV